LELLGIPIIFPVFHGKIIQQRTMDRILALDSKVFGGLDKPDSKEVLPDAIDRYAGRKRMFRSDEPLGKSQTVAWSTFGQLGKKSRCIEGDFFLGLQVLTTSEHVGLARLRIAHDHRTRDLIGSVSIQFVANTCLGC
jgi:hypothetical protein